MIGDRVHLTKSGYHVRLTREISPVVVLLLDSQFSVLPDFAVLASVRREPGRVDAWAATGSSPATSPAQRTRTRRTGPSAGSDLQLTFPCELEASIKAVATGSCVCVCVCVESGGGDMLLRCMFPYLNWLPRENSINIRLHHDICIKCLY